MTPFTTPAYTASEAARVLRVPRSVLHRWASGTHPILDSVHDLLSFQDLAELAVMAELKHRGLQTQKIRHAVEHLRIKWETTHPLIRGVYIDRDRTEILVKALDDNTPNARLESASGFGQMVIEKVIKTERVSLKDNVASLIFPFSRPKTPDSDPRMIGINPSIRFGRPITSPSHLDVEGIATRFLWGESLRDLADDLNPQKGTAEIAEAIRYFIGMLDSKIKDRKEVRLFADGLDFESTAKRLGSESQEVQEAIRDFIDLAA